MSTVTDADLAIEPLLQWFDCDHLPIGLQDVVKPFRGLAHHIVETVPRNPERTVALRKLVEAKDCAVRAVLYRGIKTNPGPAVDPGVVRAAVDDYLMKVAAAGADRVRASFR